MAELAGKSETENKQRTLSAISNLSDALNKMVKNGRKEYEKSKDINDFSKSRGPDILYGLLSLYPVNLYAECFKKAGVNSKKELETRWSRYSDDDEICSSVESLVAAEEGYKSLIDGLDEAMNLYEEENALPVVEVGARLPNDLSVIDACSGNSLLLNKDLIGKSKYTLFVLRKHYV